MRELEAAVAALREIFEPESGYAHSTKVWLPGESEPCRELKERVIRKAARLLSVGEQALAGEQPSLASIDFSEADFASVQEELAQDVEQRDFLELLSRCERVVGALHRADT
ncbi:hypothetical protein [Rehaibacterium terrae]|uniref:Uncharacterized protein n=1 Tax=Rehaibacterium terrae TaxID=1341696 RepID=A0A7W7Y1M0_9GAMM|nr:hypothetical protein [Rehaibacterium terrae]MBB5016446.1 hypothetical protein [Rehaibacterium terrae]